MFGYEYDKTWYGPRDTIPKSYDPQSWSFNGILNGQEPMQYLFTFHKQQNQQ